MRPDQIVAWTLAVVAFALTMIFAFRRATKITRERAAQQALVSKVQTATGGRSVDQRDLIDTRTIRGWTKDEWLIAGSALVALAALVWALISTFVS